MRCSLAVKMSAQTIIVCAALLSGSCSSPFGPGKVDPDWPNPDRDGEKPVPINQTYTVESPYGTATVFIEKMTPPENGTARVGQLGQIWTRISNNSDKELVIRRGISNGPGDRPGEAGEPSSLFDIHGIDRIEARGAKSKIFGFQISQPEMISYVRLSGYYDDIYGKPDWTLDFHLNWTLTP